MGNKAVITQSVPNRPPTLSEGNVDPALLWDWFVKCENFLQHKRPILPEMDWDTYKAQMYSLFLASNWIHTTHMEILRLHQPLSKVFIDFAFDVMGKNNLLARTDSFMNDEYMRETLEAAMEQDLSRECNREGTHLITDFQKWLDEVKHLDEQHCA
ncbi:hypothetical protein BDN71DRAFT_1436311 [Pleurotus eryngii]|uniref:Uncharacterized protein n=1 Tax=Pleurotus eryngii TaxID=5323 RepID=A0A9P5ZLV0_PLEER|nr:hypothetical protein BDN71DRAFT_1436311 [Pleurotus eryngii]